MCSPPRPAHGPGEGSSGCRHSLCAQPTEGPCLCQADAVTLGLELSAWELGELHGAAGRCLPAWY